MWGKDLYTKQKKRGKKRDSVLCKKVATGREIIKGRKEKRE